MKLLHILIVIIYVIMLTMGLKHNVKQISGDQLESTIN